MPVTVTSVDRGSIAHRKRLKAGDVIVTINGHEIMDVLDYSYYTLATQLDIVYQRGDDYYRVAVKKREDDELGLQFATYLMDEQRSCRNRCVFCFVDQLPRGLRDSLYFKDDDSRLSFLFGNYITLTNITRHEIDRIKAMHISPINVSVHTTNPQLRVEMMRNKDAGTSLSILRELADAGIALNAQLVLCPGLNDGMELVRTLDDLLALAPAIESIAAVPVGITKHRGGLYPLRPYDRDSAERVVSLIEEMGAEHKQKTGFRVCYASDEFYLLAGRELPPVDFYEEMSQLENGVGMVSLLCDEFRAAMAAETGVPSNSPRTYVTGTLAAPIVRGLIDEARERWHNLNCEVVAVENDFFGRTITVAGLVTATDIIRTFEGRELTGELYVPDSMLRFERDLFLDDKTPQDIEEALDIPVNILSVDGGALFESLFDLPEEPPVMYTF